MTPEAGIADLAERPRDAAPARRGAGIKTLTFTTLYPNAAQPTQGVFVENRLRHLLRHSDVRTRVVAPVPWFPFRGGWFGKYAAFANAPAHETRFGVDIVHPRYPVVPKLGMNMAPFLLYAAVRPAIARIIAEGHDFDLIDAHYFYPDGVAAALLGRHFAKPVTITARGTDLNLIPRHVMPKRMIQWAAGRAAGMVTVCRALKDTLVDLGVAPDRVRVLRNGVDLDMFHPHDRRAARAALGLTRRTLLSVGYLIERKGHDLIIEALAGLPDTDLLIAGDGPEDKALKALAAHLGVADRVRFLGRVAHESLPEIYTAADCLVLASSREGWANVLLEAMACGTAVVASDVWGTPELVCDPAAGRRMAARTPAALAQAVKDLFADPPDRAATRAYAEGFAWGPTTEGQVELFSDIVARRGGAAA